MNNQEKGHSTQKVKAVILLKKTKNRKGKLHKNYTIVIV